MQQLIIIFYRNPVVGKVKTRLAATVGKERALRIYQQLVTHTQQITEHLLVDKVVFYSDYVDHTDSWSESAFQKQVQVGNDLGERMAHALRWGFSKGYDSICIIGTDCLELTTADVTEAFEKLHHVHAVVGPATDGGYYLLGMNSFYVEVFKNKEWSTDTIFRETIKNFEQQNIPYSILPTRSDVDEERDLPIGFQEDHPQ